MLTGGTMNTRSGLNLILAAMALSLGAMTPAHAELAPPMRAMLDAAIASGKDGDIDTIAKYLKQANPADAAEIDKVIADHRAQLAAARQEQLAHQSFFQGWKGEGQIGASQTSGNSSTLDLSAGLSLTKEGLHWRNAVHGLVDYQRSNGVTSANQVLVAWEPDYKFNSRLFVFGLAQYERNRFAGFSSRDTLGAGLGYRAVALPNFTVDVKAGPTWRKTDTIGAPSTSALSAYSAVDAAWKISSWASLTEDANVQYASSNTAVISLTALTAKLNSALSARIGYQVTVNSNPPAGFKQTDSLTRFTLVYGF